MASLALAALAAVAIAARYILFKRGILFGEAAANLASLTVAGLIVAFGCLSLWVARGGKKNEADKNLPQNGGAAADSVVATVAAILGLALTGYSVSQLVLRALRSQLQCLPARSSSQRGEVFALTAQNGVNSRSGPGLEYKQLNHYPTGCTLGFDGYCIGSPVKDFIVGTPDQRWLLLHDRPQLISAGVVVSESAEADLGATPDPRCQSLGGVAQPHVIRDFKYGLTSGDLSASAPGAVIVGYSAVPMSPVSAAYVGVMGTNATSDFSAQLPLSALSAELQGELMDEFWSVRQYA